MRSHRTTFPSSASRLAARPSRRGFSIIELLVAIIIIGILVTVLIPVISSRTEQARVARVQADLENLSAAMERVAIDTGYYVRLFALNDVLRGDGTVAFNRGLAGDPRDTADGLTDYGLGQPFYQFPDSNSLFIDAKTGVFANVDRVEFIARLGLSETKYDGSISWNGPYINWQRDNNLFNNVLGRDGVADDPWGNSYVLFTRAGLFLEPNGVVVTSAGSASGGGLSSGGSFDCEVFDRPTILSLGPNGLPGDGNAGGADGIFGEFDDYTRQFGQ